MEKKHTVPLWGKVAVVFILVCAVLTGILYLCGNIGVPAGRLVQDIRRSQKIEADWTVNGNVTDTMAAYIAYPSDRGDHTFSVYVNRPGLSFGYFFRYGGSLSQVERSVAVYTVEGYGEKAYLSMNTAQVDRVEIDDGNGVQVIALDADKPFALVLPMGAGAVVFYDIEGNPVQVG